jgi:hypothetical protein
MSSMSAPSAGQSPSRIRIESPVLGLRVTGFFRARAGATPEPRPRKANGQYHAAPKTAGVDSPGDRHDLFSVVGSRT